MEDEELALSGEVELSEADLAAVMPYLPELKARWLIPLAMFAVVPAAVVMNRGLQPTLLLPMTLGAAALVYFQISLRKRWPKRALGDLGAGVTRFRFDDFGFSASSSLRQHRLAWSALARWVETPEAFAIYPTPRTLLVVPKRAFNAADVARVSQLLRSRVIGKPAAPETRRLLTRVLLAWLALIVAFGAIWLLLNDAPKTEPDPARSGGSER